MTNPDSTATPSKLPDLRWWWVAVVALCAALLTGGVMWLLVTQVRAATSSDAARAQLDAIRTALSVGVGAGGGFALWLAARRQRSTEIQLRETARIASEEKEHRDRLRDLTEFDLSERRVTDLYTKAVEQLGSDKAPVRLGGLYALERLGNGNPSLRQTIVDVLCAYLRMPYVPGDQQPAQEERQVRLTAQRLLASHLVEPAKEPGGWGPRDLDLRGAVLLDFQLRDRDVGRADFAHARFVGPAQIRRSTFRDEVWFFECKFEALVNLVGNTYMNRAIFTRTKFEWFVVAHDSTFDATAFFWGVEFNDLANFEKVNFKGPVEFDDITVKTPPQRVEEKRRRETTWPDSPFSFLGATSSADQDEVKIVVPWGGQVQPDGTFTLD